jgi:hypothetical protein
VRELAAALAVNPNTIQKAYRDLELQGYLYSVRGKGNFAAAPTREHIASQAEVLLKEMAAPIKKLKFLGVTLETVLERAAQAYEEKTALGQTGPPGANDAGTGATAPANAAGTSATAPGANAAETGATAPASAAAADQALSTKQNYREGGRP